MLDTLFGDSGYLKYYEDDTKFNYSYTINTFDYPTLHSHVDYWEFCIITEGTIKNRIEGKRAEIYPEKTLRYYAWRLSQGILIKDLTITVFIDSGVQNDTLTFASAPAALRFWCRRFFSTDLPT